jgi:hypothetical protein
MELACSNYLLFLFGIMMVARDRIELPTRGFSERSVKFLPLTFNYLPERPLPHMHHCALLCIADSRKTHARILPLGPEGRF